MFSRDCILVLIISFFFHFWNIIFLYMWEKFLMKKFWSKKIISILILSKRISLFYILYSILSARLAHFSLSQKRAFKPKNVDLNNYIYTTWNQAGRLFFTIKDLMNVKRGFGVCSKPCDHGLLRFALLMNVELVVAIIPWCNFPSEKGRGGARRDWVIASFTL